MTIIGSGSSFESATLDWAVDRFTSSGLALPALNVEFAGSGDCGGNTAVAIHGGPIPRIKVCSKLSAAPEIVLKRTLLHEIGHIWAAESLDEATRDSFLELRGLESWADKGTPWQDRGSEQAAEIMAWALMDGELLLATLSDHDPVGLAVGFTVLTGAVPPSDKQ